MNNYDFQHRMFQVNAQHETKSAIVQGVFDVWFLSYSARVCASPTKACPANEAIAPKDLETSQVIGYKRMGV